MCSQKFVKYALVMAAAVSWNATAAFAAPITLTGSYSISEQYDQNHGGPSITYDLNHPFSVNLPAVGTETAQTNFFMASPAGSCSGTGCSGVTETDTLTAMFTNLQILGLPGGTITIGTVSQAATYTAKYSGAELPCAVGDGKSPSFGATDCIMWGGLNTGGYNGYTMLSEILGGGTGLTLEIFLYNATDWNITPQIGFELVNSNQVQVPEPATVGLMGAGLLGLGVLRRRRKLMAYLR